MTKEELISRLSPVFTDGALRITARESTDLEFKIELTEAILKKSLKTIAAFPNKIGGCIVFGIQDSPRNATGLNPNYLDEGRQSEIIQQNISPSPISEFYTCKIEGIELGVLRITAHPKPPCIAIRDLSGPNNRQILKQGTVYTRRRGQSSPISGEEFSQILNQRDEKVRSEIFNFLSRGRSVGFERAVIANTEETGLASESTGMTFYIPEAEATKLNVIDKAKLVENDGAPAYELKGSVQLTVPANEDPRQPKKSRDSALCIETEIKGVFGSDFPWTFTHLRKAAENLGFWNNNEGDGVNTGFEQLSGTKLYYEKGREAVVNFAKQNPDDFISVVGSRATIEAWYQKNAGSEQES